MTDSSDKQKEKKAVTPRAKKLKVEQTPVQKGEEVKQEQTQSFTAGSSVSRPLKPNVNDIYYEFDTGNRLRYTDGGWTFIDNLK